MILIKKCNKLEKIVENSNGALRSIEKETLRGTVIQVMQMLLKLKEMKEIMQTYSIR